MPRPRLGSWHIFLEMYHHLVGLFKIEKYFRTFTGSYFDSGFTTSLLEVSGEAEVGSNLHTVHLYDMLFTCFKNFPEMFVPWTAFACK